jgi:hypothetical protein
MKVYGGVDLQIHIFLISALAADEWSALRPGRFTPGTHWIGGWADRRAGLDNVEKRKFLTLPVLELDHSVVQPVASRYTDFNLYPLPNNIKKIKSRRMRRTGHVLSGSTKSENMFSTWSSNNFSKRIKLHWISLLELLILNWNWYPHYSECCSLSFNSASFILKEYETHNHIFIFTFRRHNNASKSSFIYLLCLSFSFIRWCVFLRFVRRQVFILSDYESSGELRPSSIYTTATKTQPHLGILSTAALFTGGDYVNSSRC